MAVRGGRSSNGHVSEFLISCDGLTPLRRCYYTYRKNRVKFIDFPHGHTFFLADIYSNTLHLFYHLSADCFWWIGICNHLSVRGAQERGSSDCPIQDKVREAHFQRGRSVTRTATRMSLHAFKTDARKQIQKRGATPVMKSRIQSSWFCPGNGNHCNDRDRSN